MWLTQREIIKLITLNLYIDIPLFSNYDIFSEFFSFYQMIFSDVEFDCLLEFLAFLII